MIREKTIRQLAGYISEQAASVKTLGLYNGKAGLALSLFEVSRYLQDEEIENKAFGLLQESLLGRTKDCSFENGLSGIGYVLLYLMENGMVEADFEEMFGEKHEKIIGSFDTIDKEPDALLNALKMIYYLSSVKKMKGNDRRMDDMIRKIKEGAELYLSVHFFDFKDIRYIQDKTTVLKIFAAYLKLIDYSGEIRFSKSLLDGYARLYRDGKITSSVVAGHYLKKISFANNMDAYGDIIDDNIARAIRNIHPEILMFGEKIDLTKVMDEEGISFDPALCPHIDIKGEEVAKDVLKVVCPDSLHLGYQCGVARYLIYGVNRSAVLL